MSQQLPPGYQPPGGPPGAGGWQPPRDAGWGQQPYAGPPHPAAPQPPGTDPLAIASCAVSAGGLLLCACISFFNVPICIVGIALGFVALSNIRKRPELKGKELAIVGIVVGVLGAAIPLVMLAIPILAAVVGVALDAGHRR